MYVVQLPEGTDRDAVITELADSGVAAKPYLPCIHLMPFYRERFGFRGESSRSRSDSPTSPGPPLHLDDRETGRARGGVTGGGARPPGGLDAPGLLHPADQQGNPSLHGVGWKSSSA